jgi:pimeloyl-ACP methyl ester carboxylesterase
MAAVADRGEARAAIETGTVAVDGVSTFYRRLPGDGPPTVFLHGNPTYSEDWVPFLREMRGPGLAPDLPGFGRSEHPAPGSFDHSMHGYARFFDRFLEVLGIERHSLVVHDWGALALIGAQRRPDRLERLVLINAVPLLPGYRWHRTARVWRTPVLGELSNRLWRRRLLAMALRESTPDWSPQSPELVDLIWEHLDRGTFRAILELYRSAPEKALAAAGVELGSLTAPALVVWGLKDRYCYGRFGRAYAERLPNAELWELPEAGHWPWLEEPAVVERVVAFLEA